MMKTITLEINQGIAVLQFNRPEAMNSYNAKMAEELEEAIDIIRHHSAVRVLTIAGSGKCFMAGGDIQFFAEEKATMPRGVTQLVRQANAISTSLTQLPIPVIAQVHGSVAGIGLSFMLACDLVISASSTQFVSAYSQLGTTPDGGQSYFLTRAVGRKKAMELLLLSERFDAETAVSLGLVNRILPDEALAQGVAELCARLAKGPSQAFARIKHLVNCAEGGSLAQSCEEEVAAFTASTATADFHEGVAAFLTKRYPEFE